MLYFSNFFSQKSFPNNDIFIKIVDILSIINTSFMNEHLEKKKKNLQTTFNTKKFKYALTFISYQNTSSTKTPKQNKNLSNYFAYLFIFKDCCLTCSFSRCDGVGTWGDPIAISFA